jgi:exosortase
VPLTATSRRLQFSALSALFLFAFFPIFQEVALRVLHHEMYRHAPLVWAGAIYLLHHEHRRQRISFPEDFGGDLRFLSLGIVLYLVGRICGITYLSQLAVPFSMFGLADYLGGRGLAKRLCVPIFFLALAFPIPGKLYYAAVSPLKLSVTKAAAYLLNLWGYPALYQGNIITVGSQTVGVTDACSGLNSLMAALTLAIFYGRFTLSNSVTKWLLVLSVLPIVMGANVLRVAATAILSVEWGSRWVSGKWHTLEGLFVFMAAVLGLILVEKILSAVEKRKIHE